MERVRAVTVLVSKSPPRRITAAGVSLGEWWQTTGCSARTGDVRVQKRL
jgi:hypothetical protein